jgi:hypothetical protein
MCVSSTRGWYSPGHWFTVAFVPIIVVAAIVEHDGELLVEHVLYDGEPGAQKACKSGKKARTSGRTDNSAHFADLRCLSWFIRSSAESVSPGFQKPVRSDAGSDVGVSVKKKKLARILFCSAVNEVFVFG